MASSNAPKEPAVTSVEKFVSAIKEGNPDAILGMLSPEVTFNCPMGIFRGRGYVKNWIHFDSEVLKGHAISVHRAKSTDGMKMASGSWTVAALRFTDVVSLNQTLWIKSIKRTVERLPYTNDAQKEETEKLLAAWTGPYFAPYYTKKGVIDNKAITLPRLDFSFLGITKVRELLHVMPREGKLVTNKDVVFHFMAREREAERKQEEAKKRQLELQKQKQLLDPEKEEIVVIKAKNKEGDTAAYQFDVSSLKRQNHETALELLEEAEAVASEDRTRFITNNIKLSNNEIDEAPEIDAVFKLLLVNAFQFLTIVDLSSNKLVSVPDLSQFPIVVLLLHDNRISSMKEVHKLNKMVRLQSLTLFGNPIQKDAQQKKDYKFQVLHLVTPADVMTHPPTLRSFDHSVLTKADLVALQSYRSFASKARK